MRDLSKNFENKSIDYSKLLTYGFIKEKDKYIYEQKICDDRFNIVIELSPKIKTSKVIELSIDEEYILVDIKNSSGSFSAWVREAYENTLSDIISKCTTPNIFKSKQAKSIITYIKEKYNDDLEYLWTKFPNNAIWRNKTNNKWYGALLVIPESKLGLASDKVIEIIDLRYAKENIQNIIDNQKIFSGYHMNKDHWITIKLDGSVDIQEIYQFIDNSYGLSL